MSRRTIRSKFTLSRRTVLRGLVGGAAVSLGLPVLEAMLDSTGRALADGAAFPKRFGLFFWGNGVFPTNWVPAASGSGDAWALSPLLAPLAAHKSRLGVVTGTRLKTANVEPHISGAAGILSGAPLRMNGGQSFLLPSIDQVIAQAIGGETRFRSLEFGAFPNEGLSYNGPDSRNPPESNAKALFDRLFGPGYVQPGETVEPDPRLGVRRSILDGVIGDVDKLKARVGASDRARLDQHLSGLRDLERRLALAESSPPSLAACVPPDAPPAAFPDVDGRPAISTRHRALVDVLVMALACDQVRVFSDFMTAPVNNLLWPDAISGHHQLTHDEPGEQPEVNKIVVKVMGEFSYLLDALARIPEGDGTLADHTLVFGTTDCSLGRTHAFDEFPIVYAGSSGGLLKTDVHYRSTNDENASQVLLSLVRAMDVAAGTFGAEEGLVSQGLSAIEV